MTCGVQNCTEPARGGEAADPMCELHASMASAICVGAGVGVLASDARRKARLYAGKLREKGLPLPRGWE